MTCSFLLTEAVDADGEEENTHRTHTEQQIPAENTL